MATWYAKQTGTGNEDGTSEDDAWAVANIVWDTGGVVPGDTLELVGTITSTITVGVDGTASAWVVINIQDTIDGGDLISRGVNTNNKDYIIIQGGTIREIAEIATAAGNAIRVDTSNNILIQNVKIIDCDAEVISGDFCHGIQVSNSSNVRIKNCDISYVSGDGIIFQNNNSGENSVENTSIKEVELSAADNGDCLQFVGGGTSNGTFIVKNNHFNKENRAKQAVAIAIDGDLYFHGNIVTTADSEDLGVFIDDVATAYIHSNRIENFSDRALRFSNSNGGVGTAAYVYNNLFLNNAEAISCDDGTTDKIYIFNNTIIGGVVGIRLGENNATVVARIQNNYFNGQSGKYIRTDGLSDDITTLSNNMYSTTEFTSAWMWQGSNHSTYADWATASGDTNSSVNASPAIDTVDYITRFNSPAYRAGVNITGLHDTLRNGLVNNWSDIPSIGIDDGGLSLFKHRRRRLLRV